MSLPTGGYEYARRVLGEWRAQGVEAQVIALPDGFPFPDEAALAETAALLSGTGPLLIDALAYGAFPEALAREVGPRAAVLLHHLLCDEQGLDDAVRERLEQSERMAVSYAARVVAASPATARALVGRFGLPEERLSIAIPGTESAPLAPLAGDPPRLLTVGTVIPRKGYGYMIEALAACRDLPWTCEIVGATDHDAAELARVEAAIEAAGLRERVTLCGKVDDVGAAYLSADLFVFASLHEGYGMAVVEAMAHGLPVLTTDAGALAETAPCARLVPAEDAGALATALRPLIADKSERVALGAACRSFAQGLPGWDDTARVVARAVEAVRAPSVFSESGFRAKGRTKPDAQ